MGITDQVADFLLRKRRKSSATYEQYRMVLERIFLPWCQTTGITESAQVNDRAMERFTDYLVTRKRGTTAHETKSQGASRPLSVASIRTYVRTVRIFLTWAKVPVGEYEQIPEPERMRNVLSRQEIDRIERAATCERDKLIVRVLADTGVRVSELTGLREQDLRSDTHAHKYFIRVIGKGDREREVGLPQDAYRRLRQFAHTDDREYIFIGRRGDRLTRGVVDYVIHQLANRAGIERRVWPHLFRHSYVTQMARKKVPLQDTMKAVGHKTADMTMFIYNHTTADDSYDALMAALK